ncbi:cell agglutination protein Mam3 [Paraconiothyrium brasiliense]|uniref:Cell agglutination protein Mam3 n=1 Tax=Paraconiothyrium brasiliense TaxID=300254 RepID=A0ABR3S258_9PLEO
MYGLAPVVKAIPLFHKGAIHTLDDEPSPKSPADASLWLYLGIAIALVLAGGVFAGLTIALMGQDEIYLQVIASSGEGSERNHAKRVLRLLKRGKHWVLVTLLLSNVITNETLPIVLDRSLGGGWPAVLSSTVLIVIFGEVVPQSICVRYGLPIGAWMAPVVLALMYVMAPVAYPTAKLLDYLLGEDHGTTYKKAGLKTLVTLHKTLGTSPDDRLNEDEVTIISAVLDLKAKPVGNIMTPMDDVFTMSSDTVLDEKMMENILSAGYSRIPIHTPDNPDNFVGMLLVKMLITYDPEDALRVRDFALATLPETRPETSCLDIINFFQEGKSHMVLVSDFPGDSYGAVGVVTLEDVIEELIGEEIIDESDVFVDVHKAIRRIHPAPRTRIPKGEIVADPTHKHTEAVKDGELQVEQSENSSGKRLSLQETPAPKPTTFLLRRKSSGAAGRSLDRSTTRGIRSDDPDIRQHLKHLGPSNVASRPKATRIGTVKIKQGIANGIPNTIPENQMPRSPVISVKSAHAPQGGVGEGLLESAGREASDGVHSVAVGYGTMAADRMSWKDDQPRLHAADDETPASPKSHQVNDNGKIIVDSNNDDAEENRGRADSNGKQRSQSVSTIASLRRSPSPSRSPPKKRHTARSGSISENIVEANGVRKIVLETTSSSDSETVIAQTDGAQDHKENANTDTEGTPNDSQGAGNNKKKNRKKRGKKKKGNAGGSEENQPLLGDRS